MAEQSEGTTQVGNRRWTGVEESLFFTLIALFVSLFDPMGLDSAAERRSAQVIDRAFALNYSAQPQGRPRITLVGIDDESLAAVARQWPPQYGFYAQALKNLAEQPEKPAGIFLDYAFLSELYDPAQRDELVRTIGRISGIGDRPYPDDCAKTPLGRIACMRRAGGIPVIVGKPYPPDQCEPTKTLVMLDRVAVLVPLGWPGLPEKWTPAIPRADYGGAPCKTVTGLLGAAGAPAPLPMDGIVHRYGGVSGYDLTPAAALFAALCSDPARGRPPACAILRDSRTFPPEGWLDEPPFAILWGSRPDPAWRREYFATRAELDREQPAADEAAREACLDEEKGWLTAFSVGFREAFSRPDGIHAGAEAGCGYHPILRYEQFAPEAGAPFDAQAARLLRERFIKGRVVILGSTEPSLNDWTFTITNGMAPGMTMHGMMLDNLIEQKPLRRDPPMLFKPFAGLDLGELFEAILVFGTVLSLKNLSKYLENGSSAKRGTLVFLAAAFASALCVGLSLVTTSLMSWTPVNVQAFFAILVLATLDEFKEFIIGGVAWLFRRIADAFAWAFRRLWRAVRGIGEAIDRVLNRIWPPPSRPAPAPVPSTERQNEA